MKLFFNTFTSLMLISQTGFGFPLQRVLQQELGLNNAPQWSAGQCEDFSGRWSGKCDVNGTKFPHDLEVAQMGCSLVTVNDQTQVIGGISTISFAGDFEGTSVGLGFIVASQWNPQKTEVEGSVSGTVSALGAAKSGNIQGKTSMKIDNEELLYSLEIMDADLKCRYQRK